MELDPNTLSVLLGVGANYTTYTLNTIWQTAKLYLSAPAQQTAELIEQGKKDDTTANQQKALTAEFTEILKMPEFAEILKTTTHNEAHITGNENIVIQGSTITQTNKDGGDNVIGITKL
jgi:hypothetical protein